MLDPKDGTAQEEVKMQSAEIRERVKDIIVELMGVDPGSVKDESMLTEDFDADSLEITQFMMELESAFNIEIRDEKADDLRTVADVVAFVAQAIGQRTPRSSA